MKNRFLLVIAVLCIAFTSCSKNEEEQTYKLKYEIITQSQALHAFYYYEYTRQPENECFEYQMKRMSPRIPDYFEEVPTHMGDLVKMFVVSSPQGPKDGKVRISLDDKVLVEEDLQFGSILIRGRIGSELTVTRSKSINVCDNPIYQKN